jgi:hypothetical protein
MHPNSLANPHSLRHPGASLSVLTEGMRRV